MTSYPQILWIDLWIMLIILFKAGQYFVRMLIKDRCLLKRRYRQDKQAQQVLKLSLNWKFTNLRGTGALQNQVDN